MNTQKLSLSYIPIIFLLVFFQLKLDAQAFEGKQNLDIVFIGNSITFGSLLEKPLIEAPPVIASDYLRQQPGIGEVAFINQGRSGFTTVDFLPSIVGALVEVMDATHQLHKDNHRLLVFSISLGTNDSAEKGPNGSPVDPKVYHNNLKLITDQLLAYFPDCKIIFQQPIWYSNNTHNRSKYMAAGLARLQSYFPELQLLVQEYSKSNPRQVFMGDQKGFEYFNNNYLTDLIPETGNAGIFYLHPNKKGAIVLGKFWGKAIYQRLIKE
jgi:lysophospholipase L1-like esterase